MPINASILADIGKPGAGYSPLAAIERVGVYQDKQRERADAEAKRRADAEVQRVQMQYPDDPDAAIDALKRINPSAAAALQTQVNTQRRALVDRRKVELENDKLEAEQLARILGNGDELSWKNAGMYAQQRDPDAAKFFAQPYSPELAQQVLSFGLSAKEKADAELAAMQSNQWDQWAKLYEIDPDEADAAARVLLGPKDYDAMMTARKNADTARMNAERPPSESAGSDFRQFLQAYARDKGKDISSLTSTEMVAARRAFGTADDRVIVSAGSGAGLSPAMESNVLNRLTNQWTAATKPARDLERQVSLMDAGMGAARRGDMAQGSQAVLVTFQKILDPTSVVRESEYARSSAGLALDDRVRGAYERLTTGGAGVPIGELEKFYRLAKEAATAQRGAYLGLVKERIGRTADRYKIPRDVVFESDTPTDTAGGAPSPTGATPTHRFNPVTGKVEPVK